MADDNLPASTGPVDNAPLSFDDAVGKLSALPIDDLESDPVTEGEETEQAADDPQIDAEPDAEDVETEASAEEQDGPQEDYAGGRFAADTAKVKLDDGTVISVADLKRNNLFQRDYTRKTQEHSEAVKAFESRKAEIDQTAQSLSQTIEYIDWYAQNYLPRAPEPFSGTPDTDPVGYLTYMQKVEQYRQQEGLRTYFQTERQKLLDQQARAEEAQRIETWKAEANLLVQKDKTFADDKARNAFFQEALTSGGKHYGLTEDDLRSLSNHKQFLILKDALAYRRLQQKAQDAPKEVAKRPVVNANGTRRVPPQNQDARQRQALSERLRKTGSVDDTAALLRNLNL